MITLDAPQRREQVGAGEDLPPQLPVPGGLSLARGRHRKVTTLSRRLSGIHRFLIRLARVREMATVQVTSRAGPEVRSPDVRPFPVYRSHRYYGLG